MEDVQTGNAQSSETLAADFEATFAVVGGGGDGGDGGDEGQGTRRDELSERVPVKVEPKPELPEGPPKPPVIDEKERQAIQQVRTARRAFDTANIDFGIYAEKTNGHKYVSTEMCVTLAAALAVPPPVSVHH